MKKPVLILSTVLFASNVASAFTLDTSGMVTTPSASDSGGSVFLGNTISKVAFSDSVISQFGSLYGATMVDGGEIDGDWLVDEFDAMIYGVGPVWKSYGSQFDSRIISDDLADDANNQIRFVWLSEVVGSGNLAAYFASDDPFLYSPANESLYRNGSNAAGGYNYVESVNLGFGYPIAASGPYTQNHWLLLLTQRQDDAGGLFYEFRGGIHYDENLRLNAVVVPEPSTMILLGTGLAIAARRRRRRI